MNKSLRSPRQRCLLELLVAARRRAGLTQAEVARRVGKPQSYVAKVEGGERRLDVIELIEMCEALGADPARLVRQVRAESRTSPDSAPNPR